MRGVDRVVGMCFNELMNTYDVFFDGELVWTFDAVSHHIAREIVMKSSNRDLAYAVVDQPGRVCILKRD